MPKTQSTDVLVVGYGAAGVCAALEARSRGAEVLAIDRFNGGGATQVSGGIIYAGGGTWVQREAGVNDSADAMYAYLQAEIGDSVRPETLRRFVDTSPAMIDWLTDHGVPFEASVCPYKTSYPNNKYYLYYSGSENSGRFRTITPPAQRGHRAKGPGASGKKIYQPLAASAAALGVRTQFLTRAVSLLTNADGRVVGVRASTLADAPARIQRRYRTYAALAIKPGIYYPPLRAAMERLMGGLERRYARTVDIHARKAVILSAGGYIANREWIAEHAPAYRDGLQLGTTADDGSGITLAADVGRRRSTGQRIRLALHHSAQRAPRGPRGRRKWPTIHRRDALRSGRRPRHDSGPRWPRVDAGRPPIAHPGAGTASQAGHLVSASADGSHVAHRPRLGLDFGRGRSQGRS